MNKLEAQRIEIDLADYKMRSAQESDYHTLATESTLIYEGDTLMIAYVELDLDCTQIVETLQRIHYEKDFRTDGLPTTSRIFGFMPRNVLRKDFCSATKLAKDAPADHAVITDYAAKVADYYRDLNPALYEKHLEATDQHVVGDYRVKDSPFTSGIINKNNPLKYHFDTGNFRDVWSCMLVFKRDISGGYLSVPQYGLGFQLKHNSLFMFDGQSLLHGVTPIKKDSPRAFRYSIVYYSLREMWNCLPITDEVLRIQQIRTRREEQRLGDKKRSKEDFKK
jgi:2-oxoglutarate-Fe(II)-dependent dioxygenase family protein